MFRFMKLTAMIFINCFLNLNNKSVTQLQQKKVIRNYLHMKNYEIKMEFKVEI